MPSFLNYKKYFVLVKDVLFFYKLELFYLIILGILFGFIYPWYSSVDINRMWSQKSDGRSLIQMSRLVLDYFLILTTIIVVINLRDPNQSLIKITKYVLIITILISIIDFFTNNQIKQFFFPGYRIVENRFTGFNGEPRSFGKVCSMLSMLIIFLTYNGQTKKHLTVVLLGIIGVLISSSASAYIITFLWIFLYLIFKKKYLLLTIIFIFLTTASSLTFFMPKDSLLSSRFEKVLSPIIEDDQNISESIDYNEPKIFASFEVFDRAALNFLYNNTLYIFIGTGPNLISIPASDYIDSFSQAIYGDQIDSVPHTFIVNLISRSGLIGLFFWLLFVLYFYRKLKSIAPDFTYGASVTFLTTIFVYSNFYIFLIGVILSFIILKLSFIQK